MDIVWRILATLALVALNAYFVAAEFAAVSARLARLETDAQTRFSSRLALRIKRQLDLYLSTCQLGITIASLGLGAVTEPAIASLIEPLLHAVGVQPPGPATHSAIAIVIALSISTALHVVVGEQAPKNWAILYADRILPLLAAPLVVFTYLFYPVIWLLNAASNGLLRATGVELHSSSHGQLPHSEAELRTILSQAVTAGTLPQTNQRLLQSAFSLAELKVRQIMTPRTKIDFLTIDQPVDQLLRIVQKSAYTRLPLCDKDIDHVLGMIHMKDLFNHLKLIPGRLRFADLHTPDGQAIAIADGAPGSEVHVIGSGHIDLNAIRRDVLFVPELSPAEDLLRQFQSSHNHLAIVVDEYGSTVGLVTLEDVLEEIVGEIEDEFDVRQAGEFIPDGDGWRVSGAFPLHELKQRLNLAELDLNGVDTLGGYITRELGRWPRTGDQLQVGAYQAQVLTVNKRRATQVRLARHKSD